MHLVMRKKRRSGIFRRMFRPILSVLLLIIAFYTIVLHQNLLTKLKATAVEVFDGQVTNRTIYVQNELYGRMTAVQDSARLLTEKAVAFAAEQGVELEEIAESATFNQALIQLLMEDVIGTLRSCSSTDIFLILDGPAQMQGQGREQKAGIYLRSSSPDVYNGGNDSLLLERGMPTLSKDSKIPLDSHWQAAFIFPSEELSSDYFTRPLAAARDHNNKDIRNFGYWDYGKTIAEDDQNVLTYSVPLIAADGTVFGVLGVGDGENYFRNFLEYYELGQGRSGAYLLANSRDGKTFSPLLYSGISHSKRAILESELLLQKDELDPVLYLGAQGAEEPFCGSVQRLNLYNPNTPFEEEGWYVLGIQNRSELLKNYDGAYRQLLVLALIALVLGGFGVFVASRIIAAPLTRLMEELRTKDPNRPIHLQRLDVEEVDELVDSIESLSARVAEAFSKVSAIVEMSDSGIGVFELKKTEQLVFCSKGLYEMLGWPPQLQELGYLDAGDFVQRLDELEHQREPGEQELYALGTAESGRRWIRINQRHAGDSLLGVLTDVTASVLERQQIAHERDFDSLTGLHNRRGFEEEGQAIFAQPEHMGTAALLVWDLDNLKYINDTYGHTSGDHYIISLADCLHEFVGPGLLAARRSGDEFTVLIYGQQTEEALLALVEEIWERASRVSIPLPNGKEYKLRVSAGMAWYPRDGREMDVLFQYADFAMYTAKHSRKGTLEQFDLRIYERNHLLLQGQEAFNSLLENSLVRYALQPIVAVKDGSIYGYEMLMRSQVELFRSPMDILRMAHSQSRLYDLEVLTWFEGMKTFAQMDKANALASGSRVFINSIANQLLRPDMALLFENSFGEYLPRLVCEFTEEEQTGAGSTLDKKNLLGGWGALLAVDDYGCGYNSETMLLEISPDIVKIDMNIIRNIHQDTARQRLVKNLLLYAKERDILVLGEGVETREEMDTLVELGVDLLQGYYLAYPSFEATPPLPAVLAELAETHGRCCQE